MQREELDTLGVAPLQHLGDACVQFAPALEREPLVGTVTDQCMAEAECSGDVRVALDEFREPVPCLGVGVGVGVGGRIDREHRSDQGSGEGDAEDGGPAQKRTVAGGESVDPGRHE